MSDSLERGLFAIEGSTKEPYTDLYIRTMVFQQHTPDDALWQKAGLPVSNISAQEAVYCNRLEKVAPEVFRLLKRVLADDRFEGDILVRLKNVLVLACKLHVHDTDRSDNSGPFLGHVLAVAHRIFDIYKEHDAPFVVMAALLHDAVEDQALLLDVEKKLGSQMSTSVSSNEIEREGAVEALGHFIGMRARMLVQGVTTPLHDKKNLPPIQKNAIYKAWAQDIVRDVHNPARFAIKWADWEQNALSLSGLHEVILQKEAEGDTDSAERVRTLSAKLKLKYEPVLRDVVLPFLHNEMPETHPLYYMKDEMIARVANALLQQYV